MVAKSNAQADTTPKRVNKKPKAQNEEVLAGKKAAAKPRNADNRKKPGTAKPAGKHKDATANDWNKTGGPSKKNSRRR